MRGPGADTWEAFTTGRIVVDNNHASGGRSGRNIGIGGNRSTMSVPLVAGGACRGVLHLGSTHTGFFSPERVEFLTTVAARIAATLETARLRIELERNLSRTLEAEARQRAIVASVGEGILGAGPGGEIAFANPTALRMLGYTLDEVLGRDAHNLLHHTQHEEHPTPREECPLWQAWVDHSESFSTEDVFWRKDGSPVPVRLTFSAMKRGDLSGGCVVVVHDLTHEREQAAARDAFVAAASHELRTPMTSIMGFTELLLRRDPGPEVRGEWLRAVNEDVQHMSGIVSDLLDISRVQSGQVRLRTEPVALAGVAREVLLSTTRTHPDADVRLQTVGDAVALADRGKLVQVIANLVDNAIKYSPGGGRVTLRLLEAVEGEAWVCVEDQGMGISERDARTLFSPFQRIQRQETVGIRGTGLGLYLVRTYAEQMGGRAWVESELGAGSRFFVALPTAPASA